MSEIKIKKFYDGDTIPDGAKYLSSDNEPDYSNSYYRITTHDCDGLAGFFGGYIERTTKVTPVRKVHYYEVEETNERD